MPENKYTFKDFDESYILNLATQRNYTYTRECTSSGIDDSLYNNPATDTNELFKLEFVQDGLKCTYYTAAYTPVILKNNQLLAGLDAMAQSETSNVPTNLFLTQVFSVELPHDVEYLYVESRTNLTLNNILGLHSIDFKDSETVQLEGDFNDFFRVHTPAGQGVSAFTILAPNIMLKVLQSASDYDFEFSKNKIYFYQTFAVFQQGRIPLNRATYDALLKFGIDSAREMARAARPAKVVDTSSYQPMWKLFGGDNAKIIRSFMLVTGAFMFLIMVLLIPLFWPLLLILVAIFFVKYLKLKRKRKKLIERYHHP